MTGVPTAPAAGPQIVAALTRWELQVAARRGENLLVTLVIPAVVLVFFGLVGVLAVPEPAVVFLLPGTLALGVIATSFVNLGIATGYERHYGVLKRLGAAPVTRGQLMLAKILAVVAIELVQATLLIAIAALVLGWRPPGPASPPLALAALVLGTAAFAGLGLAMAGRLRAEATLALANGLFVAFLLLGGIVLPLDRLPDPVAAFASVLPAAPLADVFRIALGGGGDPLGPAAVLAAWATGAAAVAAATFRWD